jgi:hypothetical protein
MLQGSRFALCWQCQQYQVALACCMQRNGRATKGMKHSSLLQTSILLATKTEGSSASTCCIHNNHVCWLQTKEYSATPQLLWHALVQGKVKQAGTRYAACRYAASTQLVLLT